MRAQNKNWLGIAFAAACLLFVSVLGPMFVTPGRASAITLDPKFKQMQQCFDRFDSTSTPGSQGIVAGLLNPADRSLFTTCVFNVGFCQKAGPGSTPDSLNYTCLNPAVITNATADSARRAPVLSLLCGDNIGANAYAYSICSPGVNSALDACSSNGGAPVNIVVPPSGVATCMHAKFPKTSVAQLTDAITQGLNGSAKILADTALAVAKNQCEAQSNDTTTFTYDPTNTAQPCSSAKAGSGGEPIDCGSEGFNWLICPLIKIGLGAASKIDAFIMNQLNVDVGPIFDTGTAQGYYTAWSSFRLIATVLIVIAGLVMVASQAFGFEFLDAYTIRKTLPRLLVAIIGISLSWPLMKFMVQLFDVIGFDLRNLMYAPFGNFGGTLSSSTGVLSSIFVVGIWWAMGPVALTYLLTALLALGVGFLILVLRQVALIMLIILAPVAIACYILPNTQRVWKLWHENFFGLLLMFPIISAIIAAGHIFAAVTMQVHPGNSASDIIAQTLAIVAYFIPYFVLPLAARLATGVIGNLGGVMNNTGKGAFDRLKKGRAGGLSKRNQMRMNEQMSKGTLGSLYRRAGSLTTPGSGALSPTRQGRANYAAFRQKTRDQFVGEALKNDNGRAAGDDDATELAVQRGMTRRNFVKGYMAKGHTEQEAKMALAQSERGFASQMGTDVMAVTAFKARAGSGTAYDGSAEGQLLRINEGAALMNAGLLTRADATAAGKGNRARTDISGASFSTQMAAFSNAAAALRGEVPTDASGKAVKGYAAGKGMSTKGAELYLDSTAKEAEPGDILAGNSRTIEALGPAMMRRVEEATLSRDAAVTGGESDQTITYRQQEVDRALGAVAGMQDNLNRTSSHKAGMFADVVNGALVSDGNGGQHTVRAAVEAAAGRAAGPNGIQTFLEVRKEYGTGRQAHMYGADVPPEEPEGH